MNGTSATLLRKTDSDSSRVLLQFRCMLVLNKSHWRVPLKKIFAALCCAVMFASPLFAQEKVEESLLLAKQIVELTQETAAIEGIMPTMVERQLSSRLAMGKVENLSETQDVAIKEAIQEFSDEFASAMQPLIEEIVNLYAQQFTLEEMRGLIEFYRSDLGQRFLQVNANLETEIAGKRQAWVRRQVIPAAQKLSQKIKIALAKTN